MGRGTGGGNGRGDIITCGYMSCMNVDMMYAYKFNMIPLDIIAEPHMIDMELS